MTPPRLTLASRGSRLALRQCEIVSGLLRASQPDLEIEVHVVRTKGDADQRPFAEIGGKGLFTSEVEAAVLRGEADVAVHSAKDLTADLAEGCEILCVPGRAARRDVVVGGEGSSGEERLANLEPGARVGTSSLRRRALLMEGRPDLDIVEFRGNLDTRLGKVRAGEVELAILAEAGLTRLEGSLAAVDAVPLEEGWWVPAPGQGALALEGPADLSDLRELLAPIEDPATRAELSCERAFAARLEGGCSVPLGCSAVVEGNRLVAAGFLALPDASSVLRDRISGGPHEATALGRELAEAILSCGGEEILEELRDITPPAVPAP